MQNDVHKAAAAESNSTDAAASSRSSPKTSPRPSGAPTTYHAPKFATAMVLGIPAPASAPCTTALIASKKTNTASAGATSTKSRRIPASCVTKRAAMTRRPKYNAAAPAAPAAAAMRRPSHAYASALLASPAPTACPTRTEHATIRPSHVRDPIIWKVDAMASAPTMVRADVRVPPTIRMSSVVHHSRIVNTRPGAASFKYSARPAALTASRHRGVNRIFARPW
mmetsp:Transcript_13001/g.52054  ORF Transcript_13001/g.52054 Transcript_13001/m.52054 type:complete len:224 (+) Transcript_13001:1002-1673(+)